MSANEREYAIQNRHKVCGTIESENGKDVDRRHACVCVHSVYAFKMYL